MATPKRPRPQQLPYGPYVLIEDNILDEVEQKKGVYALGYFEPGYRDMVVKRIGRSLTDLQGRLLRYVQPSNVWDARGCSHFEFGHLKTKSDTYEWECELFHAYARDFEESLQGTENTGPDNNVKHPAVPAGMSTLCPVDDCIYS